MGYRVIDMLVEHLGSLREQKVGAKAEPYHLFSKLSEPPPETGTSYQLLLDQLQRDVFSHTMHVNHPRFFGFVPGPGNYVGVMAETLAAGYNVFAGTWLGGSAAAALETVVIRWLAELCGFPESSGGLFVSGGSLANLTALAVARHVMLKDRLEGGTVYLSDQTHSSLEKALRVLGFLPDQIRRLPTDENWRFCPERLQEAIRRDREAGLRPFCVIGTAGTTNTGAVDPLLSLREICDREQLWLHVDGAYGAAAVLAEEGQKMLAGLSLADSLSLDPHKWLFQPFETGCVLLRRGEHLRSTFQLRPDYLQDVHRHQEEINFTDLGIQLTRSFAALKVWLSFKVFGLSAFREAIAHGFRMAALAESRLRTRPDWEIVSPAQMGIICFRHRRGGDEFHRLLVEDMLEDGFALATSTVLQGRSVLRLCTINPRTTTEDIERTLDKIEALARARQSSLPSLSVRLPAREAWK